MAKHNNMFFESASQAETEYICSVESFSPVLSEEEENALLACEEIFQEALENYDENDKGTIPEKKYAPKKKCLNKKNSNYI